MRTRRYDVSQDGVACPRTSQNCLGIDRETLFPDMDGLGRYLSWKHRRIHQGAYEERYTPLPGEMSVTPDQRLDWTGGGNRS